MSYTLINADCFDWLKERAPNSITAIVTDPPYGVKEYTDEELMRRRQGEGGGILRMPPSFDGCTRKPLPRFSVINDDPVERKKVYNFFYEWAQLALKTLVPGGHVFIASTLECRRTSTPNI